MSEARIIKYSNSEFYDLEVDFNLGFISEFKLIVSSKLRRWNPSNKRWSIHRSVLPVVEPMLRRYFEYVGVTNA